MMRAKLKVSSVVIGAGCELLKFSAVCKDSAYPNDGTDEDNTFARWTPCAEMSMTVQNPALLGKFTVGDKFYVDFTPVA